MNNARMKNKLKRFNQQNTQLKIVRHFTQSLINSLRIESEGNSLVGILVTPSSRNNHEVIVNWVERYIENNMDLPFNELGFNQLVISFRRAIMSAIDSNEIN